MEDEEDDLYGSAAPDASEQAPANGDAPVKAEQMDVSEESDEDSDDDIQITTERPEGVKAESVPPRATSAKPQSSVPDRTASIDPSPPSKILKTEHGRTTSPHAPTTTTLKGAPTHAGKEGKDYPQVRTSTVNLTANPTWPGVNKPITLVEIDADLAENSKLWRLPGTDQTDFFNYGFDEYTWTQYCLRQQTMAGTIAQQREEDMQMKAMLGGDPTGGAGGMPGMGGPGGGGGAVPPGMPPMDQMMQMMMAQGMDPSKMDMNQFMAMMGGMPGGPGGGTPQPGGGQGFGGQGGFGGQSPHPQGQFQPPSGPGGGQGFGGGNMNMEGMSPQQIAIMQQEQQQAMGGQGGGGRGRGGRRGRGGYY